MLFDENEGMDSIISNCEEKMQHLIEQYNQQMDPPIPLSIAYGIAYCDLKEHDLESKENLADERMYEHKRKMKELSH